MNSSSKTSLKAILAIGFVYLVYLFFISAPQHFEEGKIITIKSGSLGKIAKELKNADIIRSETAFKSFAIFFEGEKSITPGDYKFEDKIPVWKVAKRLVFGEHHVAQIKITVPEGFTDAEIFSLVASKFPNIKKEDLQMALVSKSKMPYPLFPETYFFFPSTTAVDIIEAMNATYERKISALRSEIASSGLSEMDIITMASIIEKESRENVEKPIIAGILWKRMQKGMLLQVDAAPETYRQQGLPASPICEPGLDSIIAALRPIESEYFFYLHGRDGRIHYAKTFAEHDRNRRMFLLK